MTRSAIASALALTAIAAAGCSSAKSRPGDVRAACERYVKDRLHQPGVAFSNESVEIGTMRTRASMHGIVESAIPSPPPGGPTRIRLNFICALERHGEHWELVALTGLEQSRIPSMR
jgi:hypothetical protein